MKFAEVMLRNLDSKYKASHHVQMLLTRLGAEKPASLHGMTTVSVHWFGLCGLQPAEEKHIAPNNSIANQSQATIVRKFFVDSQHLSSQAWKGCLTNKLSLFP